MPAPRNRSLEILVIVAVVATLAALFLPSVHSGPHHRRESRPSEARRPEQTEEKATPERPVPRASDPEYNVLHAKHKEPRFPKRVVDAETMIEVLSGKIPPGTPLTAATRFMQDEGFLGFSEETGRWGDETGDYLYCERFDGPKHRTWKVAIFYSERKVVKIDAVMKGE